MKCLDLKEEIKEKNDMNEKKFMSVMEAADLLGVSRSTMYRYLQEENIAAVKIGGKTWKIPVDFLDSMGKSEKSKSS